MNPPLTSSSSSSPPNSSVCSSVLEFHGAAASSYPHSILRLDEDCIMYASSCILNIAVPHLLCRKKDEEKVEEDEANEEKEENLSLQKKVESKAWAKTEDLHVSQHVYTVRQTLRTSTIPRTDWERSITALALLSPIAMSSSCSKKFVACAFSDGTITLWSLTRDVSASKMWRWREHVVTGMTSNGSVIGNDHQNVSVADIDGVYSEVVTDGNAPVIRVQLFTASANGVRCHRCTLVSDDFDGSCLNVSESQDDEHDRKTSSFSMASYPTSTLGITMLDNQLLLGVGTALPRNNKIHFYTLDVANFYDVREDVNINVEFQHGDKENGWMYQGSVMGHLDWISCLDWNFHLGHVGSKKKDSNPTYRFEGGMLASGSQDARIRLWRFHPPVPNVMEKDQSNDDSYGLNEQPTYNMDADNTVEDEDAEDSNDENLMEEGEARLYIQYRNGEGVDVKCAITLEALLIGHEESVTSVQWRPYSDKPCLLSSSMDRSILIWMEEEADEEQENSGSYVLTSDNVGNIWVPITRVGTAGGILGGSIGSSLLGFINALWSSSGRQIVGHGFGGALYFWSTSETYMVAGDPNEERLHSSSMERWRAMPGITGHFRGCSDISWEVTEGMYLLSVGLDQTCRLWMPLSSSDPQNTDAKYIPNAWKEVGRPQVHGYDLNSVACIGDAKGELLHRFVSGADEKEVRAFDAPIQTMKLIHNIAGKNEEIIANKDDRVEQAFIPSLGLSNRANLADAMEEGTDTAPQTEVTAVEGNAVDAKEKIDNSVGLNLPTERDLGVLSLWPEVRKLYGHLTEIVCLASTAGRFNAPDSPVLVASTCKARDVGNATIRIWNVQQNVCMDLLKDGHKSTIVSLSFSTDGKFLASAGKDRRLCIWKKEENATKKSIFDLSAVVESAHRRIIWSIDFCAVQPSILASGSRDGYVKIWEVHEDAVSESVKVRELFRFQPGCKGNSKKVEAITSLSFAPQARNANMKNLKTYNEALLATGMESGLIEIWAVPLVVASETPSEVENLQPILLHSIPSNDCHINVVRKLAWRPQPIPQEHHGDTQSFTLASCSTDHGIRVYNINLSS